MCNAWNHPAECRCGWGGDGHRGGGGWGGITPSPPIRFESRVTKERFCRPTTCPVCQASPVYFIRHNGGSLWVDELGWPWEKHACFADDAAHTRLVNAAVRVQRPQPCRVLECYERRHHMTDLVIVENERGQQFFVQVASGIDLRVLAGELVILSVPDNKICHWLIPGNKAVKIVGSNTGHVGYAAPSAGTVPALRSIYSAPYPAGRKPLAGKTQIQKPQISKAKAAKAKPGGVVPASTKRAAQPDSAAQPVAGRTVTERRDLNALIVATVHPTAASRVAAISKIAMRKEVRATDAVTRRLFDIDANVRTGAASACLQMGFGRGGYLIVNALNEDREPVRLKGTMPKLRRSVSSSLNAEGRADRQYHGIILVGLLRLTSMIPDLARFCEANQPAMIRRAVAQTLWQLSVLESLPLLLLLAADPDAQVRRYAAAALADLEEITLRDALLADDTVEVRQEAERAFGGIDAPIALSSRYHVPLASPVMDSPLATLDVPALVTADQLRNVAGLLWRRGDAVRKRAVDAALLWAGETSSARPRRSRHPVFAKPFPAATLLVVGGDDHADIYRRVFAQTNLTLVWRSGFAPQSLTTEDVRKSDAVILVSNSVSAAKYHRVAALLREVGDRLAAYCQTPSPVSVARTARTLLVARWRTGDPGKLAIS